MLKTIVNNYFFTTFILKDFIKTIDRKYICMFIFPIWLFLSIYYGNLINTDKILSFVSPIIAVFNIIYITFITILIGRDNRYEKKL